MATTRRNFARAARKLSTYGRRVRRPLGGALRQIGEEIMTDAKASSPGRGVPVDTGVLRNSGRVTGPRPNLTVLLSFGDAAAPYALIQHESMDFAHTVGEPRYLVRAVDRWKPNGSSAIEGLKIQATALAARIGALP